MVRPLCSRRHAFKACLITNNLPKTGSTANLSAEKTKPAVFRQRALKHPVFGTVYRLSDGLMSTMCRVLVLASRVAMTFTFLPSNCLALSWSSSW